MDVKHSRIILSTEVINKVIRMLEVIKKTLFVYKIQIFNSMWKKYSVDFKDLNPAVREELVIEDPNMLPISVLNKLLMQNRQSSSPTKEEVHNENKTSLMNFGLKCHSISLLLQFSDGSGKGKVS
jgi:hypothetical protein